MSFKIKKIKKIDKIKQIKSLSRIHTSFMKLGERTEQDKTKYNRKVKHKKNYVKDL